MTDIVERLRAQRWSDNRRWLTEANREQAELEREAADEIEKLRAQVVSLQSSLDAAPEHTRLGKKKTPDALEREE